MPKEYLAIKRNLVKKGKSIKTAKRIAAATYNKRHPGHPVGPGYEKKVAAKKRTKKKASKSLSSVREKFVKTAMGY